MTKSDQIRNFFTQNSNLSISEIAKRTNNPYATVRFALKNVHPSLTNKQTTVATKTSNTNIKKIDHFTKTNLDNIKFEMNKALQQVSKQFNIQLKVGGIRYEDNSCTIKVNCAIDNGDGEASIDKTNWNNYCFLSEMKKEDFGKQFMLFGKSYTICGYDKRAKKYPIIAKNKNKRYKFQSFMVKQNLS